MYPSWSTVLTFDPAAERQPILADEVQSFKALITVHKILQEGHPIAVREAQANTNWLDSLTRGISGEGLRGTGTRIPFMKLAVGWPDRICGHNMGHGRS